MNENDEKQLKQIIMANSVLEDAYSITEETNLIKDLQYDSVSFVKLIIDIESEFNIEIPEEDMEFDIINDYKNLKECVSGLLK